MMSIFLLAWLYVSLSGVAGVVLAQSQQSESPLTEKDKQNINAIALRRLKQLNQLLNTLVDDALSESEVDTLIKDSYTGQSRLFDNAESIIEDDIDPAHTATDKTEELNVDQYLTTLILNYTRRRSQVNQSTIIFSDPKTTSVQQVGDSIFIQVFFKSYFKGEYKPNSLPYVPTARVVEMRAEKSGNYWGLYTTYLGFVQPGEAMEQLANTKPHEPGKSAIPASLSFNKRGRSPTLSTAHPPVLHTNPPRPPAKVVTSSMPTEIPNSKKVMSTNSLPDSLKKPKL